MAPRSTADAKNRIMEAALNAFNADGIPGVSADTIIEQAGVAKMTLYKYYPTKDALAAAFVHERSNRWMAWLADRVGKLGRTPKQRVLAVFDVLEEWFRSDNYFGCPFHRAASDFPDLKNPSHKEVIRNKRELFAFIRGLLSEAGLDARESIVNQLLLLMAGAEVMANIYGDPEYARYSRQAATTLLRK
jgi:AcrR family transcriptional regulator